MIAAIIKAGKNEHNMGMEAIIHEKKKLRGKYCFHHPFYRYDMRASIRPLVMHLFVTNYQVRQKTEMG